MQPDGGWLAAIFGPVEVAFPLGDREAVFRLSTITGRADITVGPERFLLQSPFRPSAHSQIRPRRAWRRSIDGREVEVVKLRPLLLGGFRLTKFTVFVDGVPVAWAADRGL